MMQGWEAEVMLFSFMLLARQIKKCCLQSPVDLVIKHQGWSCILRMMDEVKRVSPLCPLSFPKQDLQDLDWWSNREGNEISFILMRVSKLVIFLAVLGNVANLQTRYLVPLGFEYCVFAVGTYALWLCDLVWWCWTAEGAAREKRPLVKEQQQLLGTLFLMPMCR